ncbi:hypothetical protein CONCODRAFT_7983 [Conidiobolus coronatus NRRL 28638]|uniref:Uncharacterized protein n=1 Tax=Conidiobolus coronatus (strain ATCC 28846 / CBS 209.66 / NRRL 28638) TaxID=796925 RepID=A0A137P3I1_CONC2|nr:hypothetical protein CONCODRAFT_7983 [Conidiobolus coronatus NRRL 28638]|eukprot:KXN69570.1 hypothetical protein CONCODRAFT_7983 [Conidiobolus coronatus NRRL 28638]
MKSKEISQILRRQKVLDKYWRIHIVGPDRYDNKFCSRHNPTKASSSLVVKPFNIIRSNIWFVWITFFSSTTCVTTYYLTNLLINTLFFNTNSPHVSIWKTDM